MDNKNDHGITEDLLKAGKFMQDKGLTIETWGNISVRDPRTGLIYITPSGMAYDTLEPEDVVILYDDGSICQGKRRPSIEKMMHILIYQARNDVDAILHTHPLESTVFGVLRQEIPVVTDEMAQAIGGVVKVADYALPGSIELAENAVRAIGNVQACLLANHGTVCVGKDLKECFKVASVLETSASIYRMALSIGKPIGIDPESIKWMRDFALNHYGQK